MIEYLLEMERNEFLLQIGTLQDKIASIVSGGQFEFSSEPVNLFGEFYSLHLMHFISRIALRKAHVFNPE